MNKNLIKYGSIKELGIKKSANLYYKFTKNAYLDRLMKELKSCCHDSKKDQHKQTFSCTIFDQNYKNGDYYLTHY